MPSDMYQTGFFGQKFFTCPRVVTSRGERHLTCIVSYIGKNFKNSPKIHLWTDLHNSGCKWKLLDVSLSHTHHTLSVSLPLSVMSAVLTSQAEAERQRVATLLYFIYFNNFIFVSDFMFYNNTYIVFFFFSFHLYSIVSMYLIVNTTCRESKLN